MSTSQRKTGETPKATESGKRQSLAAAESAKRSSKTELEREIERKIKKLENFANLEGIKKDEKAFERAGRYLAEERKWINEVITRIDIVPDDGSYYDPLPVKPGFDFFFALINSHEKLHRLQVLIPEILYFN